MIPLDGLAFEDYCHNHCEHGQGDDLLNHFQLHKVERTSIAGEPDPVGRDLSAIFKEGYGPREKDDPYQRPACGNLHFLKFQMPVPGKCHKYV